MCIFVTMIQFVLFFCFLFFFFFFFNDTATTEIYTLSLHDALPICQAEHAPRSSLRLWRAARPQRRGVSQLPHLLGRSEEHTSELQSQSNLVCRLLLEKKKNQHSKLHPPP